MKSLLITILFNFFIFSSFAKAQDFPKILPLNSTRQDLVKFFGEGQKVNESKTIYDLPDQKLIVYYYADSCAEDFFKKYELTKDTVMSITIFPKTEIKIDWRQMIRTYRRFELFADKKAFFESDVGNIIVTKSKNKDEFTEITYHLPQTLWSNSCSRKYLDEDSGITLYDELRNRLEELQKPRDGGVFQVGVYFSSDSINSKNKAVQEFCQELNNYPNGVGIAYISLKKTEKQSRYAFHENYLKKQMQKNKCNLSQIKFVRSGISGKPDETFINLWIATEKILLPK